MWPGLVLAPDSRQEIAPLKNRTILVIGVDVEFMGRVVDLFEGQGFRTFQAAGVETAKAVMAAVDVDLVVFDERHSGGHAYAFCRELTVEGGAPVILLSENADVISRIVALEVGADDLLPTPVNTRLLLAQARALMRRADARRARNAPTGAWAVDPVSREAISPTGQRLRLSPQDVSLLKLFLDNPGTVFTPETVAQWIPTLKDDNATGFRTAMSRLRRKLDQLNCGEVIQTVHGAGYLYRPSGVEA